MLKVKGKKHDNSNMYVTCNKCGRVFDSTKFKTQTRYIDDESIKMLYICCPRCKEIYEICYDNARTYGLKKQIKQQVKKLNSSSLSSEEANKIVQGINVEKQKLRAENDRLRELWRKE